MNQAQSAGQRAATSVRPGSNGPSVRRDPEEAWIRNTCCFSLVLRKLFILCFLDCFIWQILGEMASSFPGSLKLLVCFCNWPFYKEWSQALTWRADVTFDHIISLKYRAWIGSAERQKARLRRAMHFPPLLLMATVLQLCQGASQSSPPSLYIENLWAHWICHWCFLHPKPRACPDVPSWPKTVLAYTCADVIVPLFLSKLTWLEWQVIETRHY